MHWQNLNQISIIQVQLLVPIIINVTVPLCTIIVYKVPNN